MDKTYAQTEREKKFLDWIRTVPDEEIVLSIQREYKQGYIQNLYSTEAVLALLTDKEMTEKMVPTGLFLQLLDIPGFSPTDQMNRTWEKLFLEAQGLGSNHDWAALLLRARCQGQKQDLDPREQIKMGHVLPWILMEMREGNDSVEIEHAKPDILRVLGKALAASRLSQGSAGSPVKALTLACAGVLAQRWPEEVQQIFSDPQYKDSVAVLQRRARGLLAQVVNRNPWDSDRWKYPKAEEMSAGISILTRQALQNIAKVQSSPARPVRPAF